LAPSTSTAPGWRHHTAKDQAAFGFERPSEERELIVDVRRLHGFDTPEGSVKVIDFMPIRDQTVDIIRIVEGVRGHVPMRMHLTIRFGYGQIIPWVRNIDRALAAVAGPDGEVVAQLGEEVDLRRQLARGGSTLRYHTEGAHVCAESFGCGRVLGECLLVGPCSP
jgi:hypothetical protein